MILTRSDYQSQFGGDKGRKALEYALDTRKFEITLYWQRTAYFWALIAAAFAGYFAVLSAEHNEQQGFNAFALACIGFIFSLAWFCVNRGSKFWQENWERHVDLLEDAVCGPLYKTVLQGSIDERSFVGGAPFSVSRVNQWVSLFIIAIWVLLASVQLPQTRNASSIDCHYIFISATTLIFGLVIIVCTQSNLGKDMKAPVINREPSLK
jgi:hypothetical protein